MTQNYFSQDARKIVTKLYLRFSRVFKNKSKLAVSCENYQNNPAVATLKLSSVFH